MVKRVNLVCITGGSSVGKTTTIELLKSRGRVVVEEAATDLIRQGILHPVNDFAEFQKQIFLLQTYREHEAIMRDFIFEEGAIICDRGIYDTLAYCEMHEKDYPEFIKWDKSNPRYQTVFLLEPLDFFEENGVRYEDLEFTKKITPILERIYEMVGTKVIRVPAMDKEARVYLIESYL